MPSTSAPRKNRMPSILDPAVHSTQIGVVDAGMFISNFFFLSLNLPECQASDGVHLSGPCRAN